MYVREFIMLHERVKQPQETVKHVKHSHRAMPSVGLEKFCYLLRNLVNDTSIIEEFLSKDS